MKYEKLRTLLCSSCDRETMHKFAGHKSVEKPAFRLFGRQFMGTKQEPVYTCTICGCKRDI